MQLYDAIQFSISNGLIACTTPRQGVAIEDFLHTMRRALEVYRSGHEVKMQAPTAPPDSCAYPKIEGECVK